MTSKAVLPLAALRLVVGAVVAAAVVALARRERDAPGFPAAGPPRE